MAASANLLHVGGKSGALLSGPFRALQRGTLAVGFGFRGIEQFFSTTMLGIEEGVWEAGLMWAAWLGGSVGAPREFNYLVD